MWAHLLQIRLTGPEGSVLGLCPCALRWMDAGSHTLQSTHTAHHRGARGGIVWDGAQPGVFPQHWLLAHMGVLSGCTLPTENVK